MRCQYHESRRQKVCAGDLDRIIEIYTRAIQPPVEGNDMQHEQGYTLKCKPFAMVRTTSELTTFDDVTISNVDGLEVFIRYDDRVTAQDFVRWEGRNIQITGIEDLDGRHEFMRLTCLDQGNKDKAATL